MTGAGRPWLICGGSPQGPARLADALGEHARPVTVAVNRSLEWFKDVGVTPDYFWLSDALEDRLRCERSQPRDPKTQIVSWRRELRWAIPDVIVDVEWRQWNATPLAEPRGRQAWYLAANLSYERGKVHHWRFSGLIVLQWVANQDPTEIMLVGMDGYTERERPDSASIRDLFIEPAMRSVITARPDIQFRFFGVPNYDLPWPADNVEVCDACELRP